MSKEIAKLLYPLYGKKALQVYYALTCKGFVGQRPSELKEWAKNHGVPSKVYNAGGREILRFLFPYIPPCISMQDQLVLEWMPVAKAHETAKLLVPFFKALADEGHLSKTSLVKGGQQMLFSPVGVASPALPNPFGLEGVV